MLTNWEKIIWDDDGKEFYNGGWVKKIESVDTNKSNGYAFEGDFINNAKSGLTECGDGYYLVCSVEGSRKSPKKYAAIFEIRGDNIKKVLDWVGGNDWALQIRDRVASLLNTPAPAVNPLAGFSTEDLVAELKRREWV